MIHRFFPCVRKHAIKYECKPMYKHTSKPLLMALTKQKQQILEHITANRIDSTPHTTIIGGAGRQMMGRQLPTPYLLEEQCQTW